MTFVAEVLFWRGLGRKDNRTRLSEFLLGLLSELVL